MQSATVSGTCRARWASDVVAECHIRQCHAKAGTRIVLDPSACTIRYVPRDHRSIGDQRGSCVQEDTATAAAGPIGGVIRNRDRGSERDALAVTDEQPATSVVRGDSAGCVRFDGEIGEAVCSRNRCQEDTATIAAG